MGAVLIAPDGTTETDHYGFIGHGTNQIAELTAALEGLSRVPDGAEVELVSDSQYVLKGLMEWRSGWSAAATAIPRVRRSPTWSCGSASLPPPMRAVSRHAGFGVTTATRTTSVPTRWRTRPWPFAVTARPESPGAVSGTCPQRSGKGALDLDQLQPGECEIRAVLVEQGYEAQVRVPRE